MWFSLEGGAAAVRKPARGRGSTLTPSGACSLNRARWELPLPSRRIAHRAKARFLLFFPPLEHLHLLLGPLEAGRSTGRIGGREAKVVEDFPDDRRVRDEGKNDHGRRAPAAAEGIDVKRSRFILHLAQRLRRGVGLDVPGPGACPEAGGGGRWKRSRERFALDPVVAHQVAHGTYEFTP
jgi:hypothetical protein